MQGLAQTTMAVVPGGVPPSENSVIKSQMWNKNKEKFLKGEPKVLGAIQVMIAFINFSLGIIIILNRVSERFMSVLLLAPFWGSIMFIFSGSLSIAAGVKPTKAMIISSLSVNTISSVLAVAASIIGVISVISGVFRQFRSQPAIASLDVLMTILNMLEFCIAVSVSAFGCKASCCNSSEVLVVLPSNSAVTVTAPPMILQPLPPSEYQGKNVPENLYRNQPGEIV